MRTLLAAAILLIGGLARGASLGGTCAPDQISILCPQTIVSGSTVAWSGLHTFVQGLTLPAFAAPAPTIGKIYFDSTNFQLMVSTNGVNFVSISTGNIAGGSSAVSVPIASVTTYTVSHNLGYYPLVQILDGTGSLVIPNTLTHTDVNNFTVTFGLAFTGTIVYR